MSIVIKVSLTFFFLLLRCTCLLIHWFWLIVLVFFSYSITSSNVFLPPLFTVTNLQKHPLLLKSPAPKGKYSALLRMPFMMCPMVPRYCLEVFFYDVPNGANDIAFRHFFTFGYTRDIQTFFDAVPLRKVKSTRDFPGQPISFIQLEENISY